MGDSVPIDSVPLTSYAGDEVEAESKPVNSQKASLRVSNLKLMISLFMIFIIVVSETFTNGILAGFGEKAVKGRNVTTCGVILQGIFVVIFYILSVYLIEQKIL